MNSFIFPAVFNLSLTLTKLQDGRQPKIAFNVLSFLTHWKKLFINAKFSRQATCIVNKQNTVLRKLCISRFITCIWVSFLRSSELHDWVIFNKKGCFKYPEKYSYTLNVGKVINFPIENWDKNACLVCVFIHIGTSLLMQDLWFVLI